MVHKNILIFNTYAMCCKKIQECQSASELVQVLETYEGFITKSRDSGHGMPIHEQIGYLKKYGTHIRYDTYTRDFGIRQQIMYIDYYENVGKFHETVIKKPT